MSVQTEHAAMRAALVAIATADLTRIDSATLCNMARAAIPSREDGYETQEDANRAFAEHVENFGDNPHG